ncbi:MAG: TIGR04283 family arsenosugar biosynthesis glycosyltransferase [Rhodospirillaceae bacterium]
MTVPENPAPHPAPDGRAKPVLSIIVPTLNAAGDLPRLIESLADGRMDREVIVADGGSGDGTQRIAQAHGFTVVETPRGRGLQLVAGAAAAAGEWFLFLHADTALQRGWSAIVRGFTSNSDNVYRAAYFQLILDDTAPVARMVEDAANLRAAKLGLPYGDQGLLISRAFYDRLEGFNPIPIMEDVDLIRRIGRRRLIQLPSAAVTSARRYQKDGYWLRPLRNLLCLALYYAGLPPRLIEQVYR